MNTETHIVHMTVLIVTGHVTTMFTLWYVMLCVHDMLFGTRHVNMMLHFTMSLVQHHAYFSASCKLGHRITLYNGSSNANKM